MRKQWTNQQRNTSKPRPCLSSVTCFTRARHKPPSEASSDRPTFSRVTRIIVSSSAPSLVFSPSHALVAVVVWPQVDAVFLHSSSLMNHLSDWRGKSNLQNIDTRWHLEERRKLHWNVPRMDIQPVNTEDMRMFMVSGSAPDQIQHVLLGRPEEPNSCGADMLPTPAYCPQLLDLLTAQCRVSPGPGCPVAGGPGSGRPGPFHQPLL